MDSENIPALPQPPASAFALPTNGAVNITDVQYWQGTKDERLKPIMHLHTMNEALEFTRDMPKTAVEDSSSRKPIAYRGPNLFVKVPRIRRAKMVPVICKQKWQLEFSVLVFN